MEKSRGEVIPTAIFRVKCERKMGNGATVERYRFYYTRKTDFAKRYFRFYRSIAPNFPPQASEQVAPAR